LWYFLCVVDRGLTREKSGPGNRALTGYTQGGPARGPQGDGIAMGRVSSHAGAPATPWGAPRGGRGTNSAPPTHSVRAATTTNHQRGRDASLGGETSRILSSPLWAGVRDTTTSFIRWNVRYCVHRTTNDQLALIPLALHACSSTTTVSTQRLSLGAVTGARTSSHVAVQTGRPDNDIIYPTALAPCSRL
jgi:hypothetical protein